MDLLPVEIINEILLIVDRSSLFYTSQICRQWRILSLKRVKIIRSIEDFNKVLRQSDKLSIIKSIVNPKWINGCLYSACQSGNKELVELMIGIVVLVVLVKEVIKKSRSY